jgi:hypothetical protein
MPQHAKLYGTYGCHLCEAAAAVLSPAIASGQLQLQEIDIIDDDELEARYALRIPVLRLSTGAELDWPFDAEAVQRLLAGAHAR